MIIDNSVIVWYPVGMATIYKYYYYFYVSITLGMSIAYVEIMGPL